MRFLYQRPFTIRATRRMSDERSYRISLIKRIGNTLDRENAECPREEKEAESRLLHRLYVQQKRDPGTVGLGDGSGQWRTGHEAAKVR